MLTSVPRRAHAPVESAEADDAWYAAWRRQELRRVDAAGLTYLDYTGSALYPESLVLDDARRLTHAVLGNPHSEHRASRMATTDLDAARAAILGFLNADPDEYDVVLTPNTSGACRLVGESFPFGRGAPLVLAQDNHNSVNGIREFARAARARTVVIPLDQELRLADAEEVLTRERFGGLFAFPAQSNFSGVRHPLSLIPFAQALGFRVLLDAAAYVPTAALDLTTVHPDFVALSVYKITGYPTGLGALVARRDALDALRRPWFAGGTVDWVSVDRARHQYRSGAERFEDGTPSFLAAGAVAPALEACRRGDRPRLGRHLAALTGRLLDGLTALRHDNGAPVARLHGPQGTQDRGATIAFTVHHADGRVAPFWEVEAAARDAGLAVRGGCFCNPGCAERAFDLGSGRTAACLDRLGTGFTVPRLAECLDDRAVGAVRMSLGLGSVRADIERALGFVTEYSK